jgi:hypothetical protein
MALENVAAIATGIQIAQGSSFAVVQAVLEAWNVPPMGILWSLPHELHHERGIGDTVSLGAGGSLACLQSPS